MPKGERTKELSFRLWKEGKSLREIQAKISGESKPLQESVKQWITEWERGHQGKRAPTFQETLRRDERVFTRKPCCKARSS
jgi:hypothetical protein